MPSARLEAFKDIFCKRNGSFTINSDFVVVIKTDQLPEFPVAERQMVRDNAKENTMALFYPASDIASKATPSCKQPSPRIT